MSVNEDVKIDLSYLDEVAGGNADFIIEMIDIFLQQTPLYVEGLKTAIDQKDWRKIAEVSHKIKPTLSFIGLIAEQEEMAHIEHQAREEINYEAIQSSFNKLQDIFDSAYKSLELKKSDLQAKL